jgi:site-specific DNA recombinase
VAEKTIRCAVYTRKSTDEGLDQSFNSLDAQREACAAYILSQRHEGWSLNPEFYDDGGFSGGNMDRPGLKALITDVQTGRIDVIVVYKVDRLTRSLADFAKMVEVFDAANVSFVSITQAFNTTTSMGRLTLNVLLSFAQFEREVTGERIRDKIAASKKKGMFMGGTVALGYEVRNRHLHVNAQEAQTVRHIFQRYTELKSVPELVKELDEQGYCAKITPFVNGGGRGNGSFTTGGIYRLIRNPLYIGKVTHKGQVHDGLHDPIIDMDLWTEVQTIIDTQGPRRSNGTLKRQAYLLSDHLKDEHGRHMYLVQAKKRGILYRYYLTHPKALTKDKPATIRVPAHELEQVVVEQLAKFLSDQSGLLQAACNANAEALQDLFNRAAHAAAQLKGDQNSQRRVIEEWDVTINVGKASYEMSLKLTDRQSHTISGRFEKVRRGMDVKLMATPQETEAIERDEKLVAQYAEAYAVRQRAVSNPEMELEDLAAELGMGVRRLRRLIELSYTDPPAVMASVEGR